MITSPLLALDAHAKARGWSVRLAVAPGGPSAKPSDRPTRLASLAVFDKPGSDGEEIETVYFPAKKEPNVNEAAALLYELVQRTTTTED